jgi:hypothetical protein
MITPEQFNFKLKLNKKSNQEFFYINFIIFFLISFLYLFKQLIKLFLNIQVE